MDIKDQIKLKEFNQARAIEHFKSVISMAELALKSAILINGGAAIALMTFVGNLKPSERHFIVYGLFVFALGVLFGGFATFCAYLAQNKFMGQINANKEPTDNQWQKVSAIWACGISYLAFFSGSVLAGLGILGCGI